MRSVCWTLQEFMFPCCLIWNAFQGFSGRIINLQLLIELALVLSDQKNRKFDGWTGAWKTTPEVAFLKSWKIDWHEYLLCKDLAELCFQSYFEHVKSVPVPQCYITMQREHVNRASFSSQKTLQSSLIPALRPAVVSFRAECLWKSHRNPATFFNSQQRPDLLTSLQDKKQRSSLYVGVCHIFAILREILGSLVPCSCSNNKDSFQERKWVCFYRLDKICFIVH